MLIYNDNGQEIPIIISEKQDMQNRFNEYCEQNLQYVVEIQNGSNVNHNLLQLYWVNFKYTQAMQARLGVPASHQDDYLQIAYLAIRQAALHFDCQKGSNFITFYRLCLLHFYFQYSLDMLYGLRIPASEYRLLKENKNLIPIECREQMWEDDRFCLIEDTMLQDLLWSYVYRDLTCENADVVWMYFGCNMTFSEISGHLSIGWERVQRRLYRSLKRLRDDVDISTLAREAFSIF